MSSEHKIWSFTRDLNTPAGYEREGPLTYAIVQSPEGKLVTGQVTDLQQTEQKLKIGDKVERVIRIIKIKSDGSAVYGNKFRLIR